MVKCFLFACASASLLFPSSFPFLFLSHLLFSFSLSPHLLFLPSLSLSSSLSFLPHLLFSFSQAQLEKALPQPNYQLMISSWIEQREFIHSALEVTKRRVHHQNFPYLVIFVPFSFLGTCCWLLGVRGDSDQRHRVVFEY